LTNFKHRFHIKEYIYHGESGIADIDSPENIQKMQENRDLAATYPPENVLNMDETGLFWKMSPNRTLATEASNRGRRSKDRITLALTVNATGTDKWEPWIIRVRTLDALSILIVNSWVCNTGIMIPSG
jgi:hypothetical protein